MHFSSTSQATHIASYPRKHWLILAVFLIFTSTVGYIRIFSLEGLTSQKPLIRSNTDLIKDGLPGQPSPMAFQQYAGYITVDVLKGRSLFYYFVEAAVVDPTTKPLILWLNGGPGCSSLGNGAFVENGPFHVQNDGRTLYLRRHSWNKVANIIFLESPAGVGFSYSNTTADYSLTGDSRTAKDTYRFLIKWLQRFPMYADIDFVIAGESYAGYYVPELAQLLVEHNNIHAHSSAWIRLKGVMVGNGLMNFETDIRGIYDFMWSHALISDQTYRGLINNCMVLIGGSKCITFQTKAGQEMGNTNVYNLYAQECFPNSSIKAKEHGEIDPCEKEYVRAYLNLPEVQNALHANTTKLPYSWGLCSSVLGSWRDRPSIVLPIYKRLIAVQVKILVYSGDIDAVIPVTSTRYSVDALNLTTKTDWRPWFDDSLQVAGYRIDYEGLTFMTVQGAGHEVPRFQPRKAFSLVRLFLDGI